MLSIDIVGLTGACSYALDCIEAELVNIKNKHGKRVAYISIRMAEYWKIQGEALQDLAMCAHLFVSCNRGVKSCDCRVKGFLFIRVITNTYGMNVCSQPLVHS